MNEDPHAQIRVFRVSLKVSLSPGPGIHPTNKLSPPQRVRPAVGPAEFSTCPILW